MTFIFCNDNHDCSELNIQLLCIIQLVDVKLLIIYFFKFDLIEIDETGNKNKS